MKNTVKNFRRWPFATILAGRATPQRRYSHNLCQDSSKLGSQLCLAILRGDNKEAGELLNIGAPIDYQDQPDGWTPLIYSIYYNNPTGRKLLLDRGADVNITDFAGRTILMFAAINGDMRLLGEILSKGVSADLRDYRGKSALDFAAEYHNDECADLLKIVMHSAGD